MKNFDFKFDWDFNSPSQTKSAQTELKDWFQRSAEEKNITQPQAMENGCKKYDINYKTLASWQKWESHEKCPIKQKQLIRIELAIKKHFKRVTLKSLWALLNVNDKNHTEKVASQTLKIFLEAGGLLIEFVWPTEQINTVGQNLKNANKSLLNFWEQIKKFKKIEASPSTAEKSIQVLEQNIKLGEEVNNFLADMSKYNVTPHINWVSPIFNKKFDDKKILMICLSAIPSKRPDVRPNDLIVDEKALLLTADPDKITY